MSYKTVKQIVGLIYVTQIKIIVLQVGHVVQYRKKLHLLIQSTGNARPMISCLAIALGEI